MYLFIFGIVTIFECTISLELQSLHIPSYVPLGTRASLSCRWQLGPADVLYSVKWYKDGKEFFRHVPREVEPRRKFPLPGVDVEDFDSSGSQLVLMPVELKTGGRYRCEVSGEGPLFLTVSQHADMIVAVLPEHGPSLSGFKSIYRPGDRVRVNCTSGKSSPPTQLAWYLNGEPLSDLAPTYWSINGTVITSLSLDFVVDAAHLKRNVLKVKCLATITGIYWRSNEESAVLEDGHRAHEHDKRNTITRSDRVRANSSNSRNSITFLMYSVMFCNIYVHLYL